MTETNADLAALIGSRICHDLISPIGAISNGIELMALAGSMDTSSEEVALISDSCRSAAARIRFFRVAFGISSPGQTLPRDEVRAILDDVTRGTAHRPDWQAEGLLPRPEVQRAFLAFLCFEAALPRGGEVRFVRDDDACWEISTAAEDRRVRPELWNHLTGDGAAADPGAITPAQVQFRLLAELAAADGRAIRVTDTGSRLTLAV